MFNGLPWKQSEIILLFLRLHPGTAFLTLLLTMRATPFLLRGCYLQYQIQCSYELNSPIQVHFSLLIPKMSMFILAISCLTTSNLPWCMDLTSQVPLQYCSLQHWTLLPSPVTSTNGHLFCLGSISSFFLSYFSTLLQWYIGHLPTWGVHLSVSFLFAFPSC